MPDDVVSQSPPRSPAPGGLYGALRRAFEREGADRAAVLLALVLLGFSLDTGLAADDYIHMLMARGGGELAGFVRAPLDLFRFTTGPETALLMREGVLSWWDDPQAKLAFLRPVSSLSHYLDHLLWNDSAWLMHLHSIAWAALAFFGVLAVYRLLLGPGLACSLAIFIYAFEDGRGWFGSWIAARNAVIATALSTWTFWLYARARREQSTRMWLGSAALLLVALLAGEGSIAICAYLAAYALVLDRGTLRERVLPLVPHALVVVGWRIAYRALDYGAQRSGLYFDPMGDPSGFLHAFVERAPVLLFSQLGGSWSDGWSALFAFPTLHGILVGISSLAIAAVGYALWPLLVQRPVLRFAVLGSLLALVPASSAFIADRLLTWVAIGASLALGELIATYLTQPDSLRMQPLRALILPPLMLWLVVDHAVLEPLLMPSRARGNLAMRDILDRAQAAVPSDDSIRDKHVIYVNPAAIPLAAYVPIERAARGEPRPAFQTWLAAAESEVRVSREDATTLRVRQRGGFIQSPPSQLLCGRFCTFEVGATVDLGPVEIEVTDITADGRPAEILAHFDRELEDPRFVWLRWDDTSFAPFTPPAEGQSVVLPPADYLRVTLGDAVQLPFDGRLPAPADPHWAKQ